MRLLRSAIALLIMGMLAGSGWTADAPKGSSLVPTGRVENGVRIIELKALRYRFDPDPIVVKLGEKVRIIATSADVAHGYAVSALKVNAKVEPGKESVIEFTAEKEGRFDEHCTVFCGPGHKGMRGTLIVIK